MKESRYVLSRIFQVFSIVVSLNLALVAQMSDLIKEEDQTKFQAAYI
jgi:hypothetical protein